MSRIGNAWLEPEAVCLRAVRIRCHVRAREAWSGAPQLKPQLVASAGVVDFVQPSSPLKHAIRAQCIEFETAAVVIQVALAALLFGCRCWLWFRHAPNGGRIG